MEQGSSLLLIYKTSGTFKVPSFFILLPGRCRNAIGFPPCAHRRCNQVKTVQVLVMVMIPTMIALMMPAMYGFFVLLYT